MSTFIRRSNLKPHAALANQPFGQYSKNAHSEMQPSELVKEVSRQAMQRHEAKVKESELHNLEAHNVLISNMAQLDHSLQLK